MDLRSPTPPAGWHNFPFLVFFFFLKEMEYSTDFHPFLVSLLLIYAFSIFVIVNQKVLLYLQIQFFRFSS